MRSGLSRLGQYTIVLIVAVTLNFFLPRLMPGDPLALVAGADVALMSEAQRTELMEQVGLNDPLRYSMRITGFRPITGDFGYSLKSGRPIADIIAERLPWTLLLSGGAVFISALFGITLGAVSAGEEEKRRPGAAPEHDCRPIASLVLARNAADLALFRHLGPTTQLRRRDSIGGVHGLGAALLISPDTLFCPW
jgi:hypothetical protein